MVPTLNVLEGRKAARGHAKVMRIEISLSLNMKNKGPHMIPRTSFFVSWSHEFTCTEHGWERVIGKVISM